MTVMKKIVLAAVSALLTLGVSAQPSPKDFRHGECAGQPASEHHHRCAPEQNLQNPHAAHFGEMSDCRKKFHKRPDAQTMAVRKALRLKEELLLSDKQFDDVYKVYYEAFKKVEQEMSAHREFQHGGDAAPDSAQIAQHREVRRQRVEEMEKPMKKILNPEQLKRWKELQGM